MSFRYSTDPLIFALWLCFAVWPAALAWTLYCLARQPRLARSTGPNDTKISILVPARNEERRILAESLESMLAQESVDFEVVVLNDRSTDATEKILATFAERFEASRFRYVNGTETPAGWLGKPHALRQANEAAAGDWILTTDADIMFDRAAVRSAVNCAETNELDALSLLPRQSLGSFWEQLFLPVFAWFCLLLKPLHRVNDRHRPTALGSGNFFLIRRDALNALGGFECVKDDVAEDLRLAQLLKTNGFSYQVRYAPELLSTRMYTNFGDLWHGFSKNFYSGMKFSLPRTLAGAFWILILGVLPPILALAALAFNETSLFAPLIASYVFQVVLFAVVRVYNQANPFYALLAPLGFMMFVGILLNSAAKIKSGTGVVWKGRKIYETGGVVPPKQR
jgi:chlorobactene glucosyltransferase